MIESSSSSDESDDAVSESMEPTMFDKVDKVDKEPTVFRRLRSKPAVSLEGLLDPVSVWRQRADLIGVHVDEIRRMIFAGLPPLVFHMYQGWKGEHIPEDLHLLEAYALCFPFNKPHISSCTCLASGEYPTELKVSREAFIVQITPGFLILHACYRLVWVYCGKQACCRGFRSKNLAAVGLDLEHHNILQNIMSDAGMENHLLQSRRLKRFLAMMHQGIVCSNFIWLCRNSTGRSEEFPSGFTDNARNQHHNVMVSRTCLLQRATWSRFVKNMLEQPTTSIMPEMERVKENGSLMSMQRTVTYLGSFNEEMCTSKGLVLLHDTEFVHRMNRSDVLKSRGENTAVLVFKHGDNMEKVTGVPAALKQSQEYPIEFGNALADYFHQWMTEETSRCESFAQFAQQQRRKCSKFELWQNPLVPGLAMRDLWDDAEMFKLAPRYGFQFGSPRYFPWETPTV